MCRPNNSGSFAMFAAIRRASSLVSNSAVDRRPWLILEYTEVWPGVCLSIALVASECLRCLLSGRDYDEAKSKKDCQFLSILFFPYPARAVDVSIKNRREFTAAETGDVDVLARFPGNRQNFVDGKIGVVASVTFEGGQPLELNGGEQIVVLEQRGARLMNAGVSRENELRHLFNALFLGIARRRSGDQ